MSEIEDIIINEINEFYINEQVHDEELDDDLPKSLIITGVPEVVYTDASVKRQFEEMFYQLSSSATFEYLHSFNRARVNLGSTVSATTARIKLHGIEFFGSHINCFFAKPPESSASSTFLDLPKPYKQFLISPPSSPPVGWEAALEKEPTINYDLISAITNLAPGGEHEVQAASPTSPSIVVHICEDPDGFKCKAQKVTSTKCPPSLD